MISIGRPNFRLFLSLVIAILVIALALYYRSQLMQALSKISIGWTLAGLIIYMVNYALRALRLKLLSHNQIRWWPGGLYVACAHGFATYIIPFRAGDLSLPVILRSVSSVGLVEGGRMLIKARLLDVQALGLWILIAAVTVDFSLTYSLWIIWLASGDSVAVHTRYHQAFSKLEFILPYKDCKKNQRFHQRRTSGEAHILAKHWYLAGDCRMLFLCRSCSRVKFDSHADLAVDYHTIATSDFACSRGGGYRCPRGRVGYGTDNLGHTIV